MTHQRRRRRSRFSCLDCRIDTDVIGEYYSVRDEVWTAAVPDQDGMLCIGCLEARIHRRLTAHDFTDAPINFIFAQSLRLISRLRRRRVQNHRDHDAASPRLPLLGGKP